MPDVTELYSKIYDGFEILNHTLTDFARFQILFVEMPRG